MPHHHHPRHPEEDDVEAGDQHVGRIVPLELRRRVRPAERRERPQCGGEPRVENVLVARQRDASFHSARWPLRQPRPRSPRRRSCHPARTTPGSGGPTTAGAKCTTAGCCASIRNRSSPSSSGTNTVLPFSTAAMAGFGERLGIDIPLLGEPRLDDDAGAVAVRHLVACAARPCREAPAPPSARRCACAPRSGRGRAAPASSPPTSAPSRKSGLSRSISLPKRSRMLTSGRSWRRPTSKSLKSWPA